jgi:hypothetical protein
MGWCGRFYLVMIFYGVLTTDEMQRTMAPTRRRHSDYATKEVYFTF